VLLIALSKWRYGIDQRLAADLFWADGNYIRKVSFMTLHIPDVDETQRTNHRTWLMYGYHMGFVRNCYCSYRHQQRTYFKRLVGIVTLDMGFGTVTGFIGNIQIVITTTALSLIHILCGLLRHLLSLLSLLCLHLLSPSNGLNSVDSSASEFNSFRHRWLAPISRLDLGTQSFQKWDSSAKECLRHGPSSGLQK
jgi:hypothetical protein